MVDPAELEEGTLANKQVWISKLEATRSAKEKVSETRMRGGLTDRTRTGSSCGWRNERVRETLTGVRK